MSGPSYDAGHGDTIDSLRAEVARLREERVEVQGQFERAIAQRDALRAVVLQIVGHPDDWKCGHCGGKAACFGIDDGNAGICCDGCCGHGNEDCWCMPVEALRAAIGKGDK